MKKVMFFLCMCIAINGYPSLFMTHAYLAEKWIEAHDLTVDEKRDFMLGNLFPDIRYLCNFSRKYTHFHWVTKKQITKEKNIFIAGMKLHSYIDNKREKLIRKWKIYPKLKVVSKDHYGAFLKLLEDQILFEKYSFESVIQVLGKTCKGEEEFTNEENIKKWHLLLLQYFHDKPSNILYLVSLFHKDIQGVSFQEIASWSKLLPVYAKDPEMISYFNDLVAEFEKSFHR
jgi:hypothetical protein